MTNLMMPNVSGSLPGHRRRWASTVEEVRERDGDVCPPGRPRCTRRHRRCRFPRSTACRGPSRPWRVGLPQQPGLVSTGIHSPAGSFTRISVMIPFPSRSSGPSSSTWSSMSSFHGATFRPSSHDGFWKKCAPRPIPCREDEPREVSGWRLCLEQASCEEERRLARDRHEPSRFPTTNTAGTLRTFLPARADLDHEQVGASRAGRDPVQRGGGRIRLLSAARPR